MAADLVYLVDDVAGTPTSKKATVANLAASAPFSGLYAPVVSGLIGVTSYNPGSQTTVLRTSTTLADVDATNLAVSFTVPASGKVVVSLETYAFCGPDTGLAWGLREGSTDITSKLVNYNSSPSIYKEDRVTAEFHITGLTPGASKTYKWSAARAAGSSDAATRYGGTALQAGQAVMKVLAAPA